MSGVFEPIRLPDAAWRSPAAQAALQCRDVGGILRLAQQYGGASQHRIANAVGILQGRVSEILKGTRAVTGFEVIERVATGLNMPDHARLAFGLAPRQADARGGSATLAGRQAKGAWAGHLSDVAVFANRSHFASSVPLYDFLDGAGEVRAMGLSLNLICQHFGDSRLEDLLQGGASVRCLFLDPDGAAIKARDREEGWPDGRLAGLTSMNIAGLQRIRERLGGDVREHLLIRVYEQTVRFNIMLVDDQLCVAQPYLPHGRGVNAPTMVIRREQAGSLIYSTFERIFTETWEQARDV